MSDPQQLQVALRALRTLAAEDRRRGIEYWYDRELADALRELVRIAGPARAPSDRTDARAIPQNPPDTRNRDRKIPEWGPAPCATGRPEGWKEGLERLAAEAAVCRNCGLCGTRTQVVFGAGRAETPLVFVGEAPGADEDAQGIPFVGRAGQLLTRIISAIGLSRDQVYIANILKCRPPGNRNPAPDEIAACRRYLDRQLDLLRPKVICTLGLTATQAMLESSEPIGRLRGRVFERNGCSIVPTYHPAALLRNPAFKAVVWEDVQKVRRILDSGTEQPHHGQRIGER